MIKLSKIKPNPDNPRIIKNHRFEKLCENIKKYPKFLEKRPLVIDSWDNPIVLGGNQRLRALQELGYKEIPDEWVQESKDWTEEEKRAFIIIDNVAFGEEDWDRLANEWSETELQDWGMELKFMGKETQEDYYTIPDEIETDIKAGDLFEIGHHRLLCGDSTKPDDVERVMQGCKPILMVTDPPYGVNYDANWRNEADRANGRPSSDRATMKVTNDNRSNWTDTYNLFKGDILYVWHGDRHAGVVQKNIEDAGFELVAQIVWAKNNIVISRGDYHFKHEPCWYAVRKGKKHNWQGSRKESSLWEIDKPQKSETGHSTQKPVECMARPIRNNSYERETVYDPFLGSGTTMVAAHQLNRKCIGIELEPKYCQIIIDRMQKLDPEIKVKKI